MFRLFFVVFYRYNNQSITCANHKYKSSKVIDGSIILLAVISCVIGGCLISPILSNLKGLVKFHQTINLLFSWSINKAELCTFVGMVLAFIFYIYKPNVLNFLKIKIKNNFLFFYDLLEQQYFFNKLNNFILQCFKWFAELLFKFIEELFFNKYINQGATNLVVYISRCIQNLHMDNLSNYIFLMFNYDPTRLKTLLYFTSKDYHQFDGIKPVGCI
jgi:NADH:ubiquinone oxidoreductase subunit 5 (subunit L)/multisubunit Na+/H+ antiporter MnhA subunit